MYPKRVGTELISFNFGKEFPKHPKMLCRIWDY